MSEALQNYVSLVNGLTRGSRERFTKLAEEILQASKANRELVENLFVAEVERAAGRLGFARAEEVQALGDKVDRLAVPTAASLEPELSSILEQRFQELADHLDARAQANDIMAMREEGETTKEEALFNEANCKNFVFKVKAKMDTFQDQQRYVIQGD